MEKLIDVGNISLKNFLKQNFDDDVVAVLRDEWSYPLIDMIVKNIDKDIFYHKCEVLQYSIDDVKRITVYIGAEMKE